MTPAGTHNELDVQNEWKQNTHTLEIKRDMVAESGRRYDMPTCIQLVYLGHVEMQLVNGAFQFQLAASIGRHNE